MGKNTLTLGATRQQAEQRLQAVRPQPKIRWQERQPAKSREPASEISQPADSGVLPAGLPVSPADHTAPPRKYPKPRQAAPGAEWWGVLAVDKVGRSFANGSRPIFRHPTQETAMSEAEYLSALHTDRRFVVLHCCASFVGGNKQ